MNRIGGKSNTGEGGEDPERFVPLPNGDSKNSAIKQVASGRFGVTSEYLVSAREIQIKMAQGAKPGEGGQLPGTKVYPWIAKTRHTTAGVGLISPPPHHDIYSIEDLAELIHDLKNANRRARISVKLVAEVGVGTIAAGVAKAHADVVLISGYDGGTGASPQTSIMHAGLPWELGLAETHQTLVLNNLRSRIVVETDGQLKTGRDVAIAALLGAEEFGFATAPLVATGCIMMRVCHLNTCPVGVATQDPRLRENFTGKPEHVVNFMRFIAEDLREIMAQLGFRTRRGDGRPRRPARAAQRHRSLEGEGPRLHQPPVLAGSGPGLGPLLPGRAGPRPRQVARPHGAARPVQAGDRARREVVADLPIRNVNRVVGTITGSEITRKHGAKGLPADTIRLHFRGSAGQSFGAFIPPGMTLSLEGDANDYVGKGLSGGKIIVFPPRESTFAARGQHHRRQRGAVRRDQRRGVHPRHGGRALLRAQQRRERGRRGGRRPRLRVHDRRPRRRARPDRAATSRPACPAASPMCSTRAATSRASVNAPDGGPRARSRSPTEIAELRRLVERHLEHTSSDRARQVLDAWDDMLPKFVKVMPRDYKRMLDAIRRAEEQGLVGDEAIMVAFEENARDLSRVGGN